MGPSPSEYEVAIPSYRRPAQLATKTLPLLLRRGVPPHRITVVVANEAERVAYARNLSHPAIRLSVAAHTLRAARHHIAGLYPAGTPVVQIDDDVSDVVRAVDKKTLKPVTNLHGLFVEAFERSQAVGAYLWGVAPVSNAFYLAPDKVGVGLKFCIGTLFGWWSRGADHVTQQLVLDEKEDYERTLRFFEHDGKVLRFDGISMKTKHYEEPGGMQAYRTVEDSHTAAGYLMGRWPHLVHLNTRRAGPRAEIVLRRTKVTA